ncbi:protein kinase family protein [Couchioplanes caeruleus]|uniref:Serine/threonine protein kinase n=2 Tax=Couchioplanes caeruleus TaxID=56438 RepID=A0A1K0F9V3_9ACTN|nr:protein kinase family protein [Couchioplanes caeruleus]OJF09617.1 serine/threonine protein kinase [Couchioplanes caeruleus subsp. caeruleus]ROP31128.1 protein kinase-like protein [Couchioplanes caeruleus]
MTQVGEGHETAADEAGPVMTFGAPTVGEILAERYQLEEHVNNDSAGRQVWRGIDVILRRPVAVVLRYPGGESAAEMLQAAVDASRVIHPNLVGVYDAIDEGTRAYVVREWVDGEALREFVSREGPLDPARATAIAHSIVDALAAVHATGMVHGNVHPGTTLIADDGRVVLADARADSADSIESDIRAVGGILYYSLTGRWPHAEAGTSALPDAMRDGDGAASTPRQIRAGVPAYLDDLTMDLLDKGITAPEADALTAELARLDAADEEYEEAGPLRFTQGTAAEPVRSTRQIVVGVAALVVIALIGLVFGIRAISNSGKEQAPGSTQANTAPQGGTQGNGDGGGPGSGPQGALKKIALTESMVRIVDPPNGEGNDSGEAKFTVDEDKETGWETQRFRSSDFGNLKDGMGVLINLGSPRHVSEIRVEASAPGVAMDIRTGPNDPGDTRSGDDQIVKTYKKIGDEDTPKTTGTKAIFPVSDGTQTFQYLLVFLSDLPPADDGEGGFKVEVTDIQVYAAD